ncbi:hypothetical protein KKC88_03145 [Patescibacteria group bacterium]|nr:hypothetical protein [Patescibacteria group bacterium]MBU1673418.1 hypothetical protein [Patescibacteria group bacterium]MBU1963322.1 hypothetical protein [Patescibacteria group bacterium]
MKDKFLKQLKTSWKGIVLFTLVIMSLAVIYSVARPMDYSSKIQALVIYNQSSDVDSYTAAKSAEKIGKSLSSVVGTTSFMDLVVKEGEIDLSEMTALSERDKRKEWSSKVSASVIPETGILEIEAYDPDPQRSAELASAVAATLIKNADEYHGGGDAIQVKVVNQALTSTYPVRPNLMTNLAAAFIFSVVVSLAFVFLKDDVKKLLKLENKRSQNKLEKLEDTVDEYINEQPVQYPQMETMPEQYVASEYNVLDPNQFTK